MGGEREKGSGKRDRGAKIGVKEGKRRKFAMRAPLREGRRETRGRYVCLCVCVCGGGGGGGSILSRGVVFPANNSMRGFRGGTGGPDTPPPLRFVRGGVLCGYLMGRRGGPMVGFLPYLIFVKTFSGSLRSPVL